MNKRRRMTAAIAAAVGCLVAMSTQPVVAHPTHDGSGKEAGFDLVLEDVSPGGVPMERLSDIRCEDQMAGIFPCHKTDLKAFVPLGEMDSIWSNDIWGWTDPQTDREYALVGLYEGTSFVDVTNPSNPTVLGMLPSHTKGSVWRDIKVYDDHAYVISEAAGHGMQVFDLTRLRGVTGKQTWTEDGWLGGFGHAHNLALNEDTGHAYIVGAVRDTTACPGVDGGPIIVDLADPKNPAIEGCYGADGYTHDVHCVVYHGPDSDYTGREICSASNEDTVTVLDATDPGDVKMLARVPYETASYTHQGWFTEDHQYFLMGDELDELTGEVAETTTYIFDMNDLDDPQLIGTGSSGLKSIDHNIFIKDKVIYESNYTSGLRMFDSYKLDQGRMKQIGWFDTYPVDDDTYFAGTWSNYPYFDSGIVVMTGVEEGLFVLKPRVKSSAPHGS